MFLICVVQIEVDLEQCVFAAVKNVPRVCARRDLSGFDVVWVVNVTNKWT